MLGQFTMFAPSKDLPLRQRVQLEIVSLEQARHTLEKYHYLHRARVGRQINYAVIIDGVIDGVITYAYPMMSAPLLGVPADELVEFARLFLFQNIPHTATCAIGKSVKRIQKDWSLLFPDAKPIQLIVSWSDTVHHKGTIYKAANFEWIKRTSGGGVGNTANSKRGARKPYADYDHPKDCWVYWLERRRTPHAVDSGGASPPQSESTPEDLSTQLAVSTPTPLPLM
jgi:hypothetical protein